eukprot:TRINITY_DN6149_c0_g1_i6.p1 TRINITY_DN6149_c0_g1~~TRINITY_DN6149_c0_g1_i6.p1  ORF type:complete len:1182 (+),score=204.47 TRINITY_DN6149_c0_g1_i6:110-3655(+)
MQKFESILKSCRESKTRFTDTEFPATESSLYLDPNHPPDGCASVACWKRLVDIGYGKHQLFVDGAKDSDVIQGRLGDCYLLGALSVITIRPDLFQRFILESYPEFSLYLFQFYKEGEWRQVIIDDYVPVDEEGRILYAKSSNPLEMWVSLVEKAYAKLHTCYHNLDGGSTSQALVDLTGGVPEKIDLDDKRTIALYRTGELWKKLIRFQEEGFLMGCGMSVDGGDAEVEYGFGILQNHAYGVMAVVETKCQHKLLRIRNPWGQKEWRGAWSDHSPEWTPQLLEELHYEFHDDGTFWMEMEDFMKYFNKLYICRLYDDDVGDIWCKYFDKNEWTSSTAGGCLNNKETWMMNKQYYLCPRDNDTTIFIVLNQEDCKIYGKATYENNIGFVVAKHGESASPKTTMKSSEVVTYTAYGPFREVSCEITLSPSTPTVVIPTTYEYGKTGKFFLTVYADNPVDFMEIGASPLPDISSSGFAPRRPSNVAAPNIASLRNGIIPVASLKPTPREPAGPSTYPSEIQPVDVEKKDQFSKLIATTLAAQKTEGPWVDPDFTAAPKSLFPDPRYPPPDVPVIRGWRRISSQHPGAVLFRDNPINTSIIQGGLGDGYFLGALAAVATKPDLLARIFVSHSVKLGIYHLRFFKDGEWVDVVVDDLIPHGDDELPAFGRSSIGDEAWVIMAEKAYAKLHRCYLNIDGGGTLQALVDLTGGAPQKINLDDKDTRADIMSGKLWDDLVTAHNQGWLMACSCANDGYIDDSNENGILHNHAYTILDLRVYNDHNLLLVRNPWGDYDWKGPWSSNSREWTSDVERDLGPLPKQGGRFWMTFEDLVAQFNKIYICRLYETSSQTISKKVIQGEWTMQTSGGCLNFKTWVNNPQYAIIPTEPQTSCFVLLRQPDTRVQGKPDYDNSLGFVLVRGDVKRGQEPTRKVKVSKSDVICSSAFGPIREVGAEIVLDHEDLGEGLVIIPSTFHPERIGKFSIVVYSQTPVEIVPITKAPSVDSTASSSTGLKKRDSSTDLRPIIHDAKEKQTEPQKGKDRISLKAANSPQTPVLVQNRFKKPESVVIDKKKVDAPQPRAPSPKPVSRSGASQTFSGLVPSTSNSSNLAEAGSSSPIPPDLARILMENNKALVQMIQASKPAGISAIDLYAMQDEIRQLRIDMQNQMDALRRDVLNELSEIKELLRK